MREDELATRLVEHYTAAYDDATVALEEPYDAEGRRGLVDVYVQLRTPERVDHVIELKSDAAVRRATGANELLRQFRRAERYFYEDPRHAVRPKLSRRGPAVHLLLFFAPTPTCVHHVATHARLYESIDVEARIGDVQAVRKVAFLTGLEGGPTELGFLSINGDVPFGSPAFRAAVPDGSRLAESLRGVDDDLIRFE
ncbi:hypothetical protein [Halorubrum vacuolatum]|uniref:Uncharacterized protein n=1 Tax=Halorubrum vacuolatum TaxID=63740 RepID=A0A238WZM6_HALVU|nr:hypothetical protein [Halorubrum vacuolatum]SNR51868.1 hypothetical protein SAMN06264855_11186 [Halorubrum vacuolatum]